MGSGIPLEYLSKMGTYEFSNIHGARVTACTCDCEAVIDEHVTRVLQFLNDNTSTKVVGLDLKCKSIYGSRVATYTLVLCVSSSCLIIHLDHVAKLPEKLVSFLKDSKICFVGSSNDTSLYGISYSSVKVGELAATVLKKPSLVDSTLATIAREAGVAYEVPSWGTWSAIHVQRRYPMVLTDEQAKIMVRKACAYYQIGYKLLSSL